MTAIVVRFAPGEVTYPEAVYPESAPLERVLFRTPQVRAALAESGVYGLSVVSPGWRHLEAPQYDIDGEEIPIEQMVDFADVYRLEWDRAVPARLLRERMRTFPRSVRYVDLLPAGELDYTPPDDELFDIQWGLHNTGQTIDNMVCQENIDINALEAWDYQDTCIVRVGVMDLGVDRDHEDLADAIDPDLWFSTDSDSAQEMCTPPPADQQPHGSAVAGIIGATGGNDSGMVGVASPRGGIRLVPMTIAESGNSDACAARAWKAVDALSWVAAAPAFPHVKIVNSSWGIAHTDETDGVCRSLRDAARNVYLKGIFLAVSMGNSSLRKYPGAFADFATTVSAVRCDGTSSPGYHAGPQVDVAAPGGERTGTANEAGIVAPWGSGTNDEYWGVGGHPYFGGTSAAAPFVSGVAALVLSKPIPSEKALSNDDVTGLLRVTATDLGAPGFDSVFGDGLVRADSALMLITPPNRTLRGQAEVVRIDSVGTLVNAEFMNIPCITNLTSPLDETDTLTARVYEMRACASFAEPPLAVWTRGRSSIGWRYIEDLGWPTGREENPCCVYDGLMFGNWAEVVEGTVTAEACSLRSYTYKFFRDGAFVGWYPVDGVSFQKACTSSPTVASLAYTYVVAEGSPAPRARPGLDLRVQRPGRGSAVQRVPCRLSTQDKLRAAVFDVSGRRVRNLLDAVAGPGLVRLDWDERDDRGARVPSGVYFVRVAAGEVHEARKLLVVPRGGGR